MENLDPNKININEMSDKNIFIYYIGYKTVKNVSYAEITTADHSYLIIIKIN